MTASAHGLSPEAQAWLRWWEATARRSPSPEVSNRAAAYYASVTETALEIAIWERCAGIIDGDDEVVPGLWADVMGVMWCSD